MVELTARNGGAVRTRSLKAHGATDSDIRRAIRAGDLLRLREGVVSLPDAWPDVVDAARHGGEVSCVTALRMQGVWIFDGGGRSDPHAPHVWVGGSGRRHAHDRCACITHNDAGIAGFGVASVILSLVQVARCQGAECFFVAFESAWRLGLLTRSSRREVRAGLPASMRWLVDIARPDADSGLESLLRLRLRRLGILLRCQVVIDTVGRVDFLLDGVIILEVDGRLNHEGPSLRHKDLVRDARAAALGYETLRFDYALVVHDWETVRAAILARLEIVRSRMARSRH